MIKAGDTMAFQFSAVGKFTVSFSRNGDILRSKNGDRKHLVEGGETTAFDIKRMLENIFKLDAKLSNQGEDFLLFEFIKQEK